MAGNKEPKDSLIRLKRWVSRERGRCRRIAKLAEEKGSSIALERACGEANVLLAVIKRIDKMLKDDGI